jgi:putative transposase
MEVLRSCRGDWRVALLRVVPHRQDILINWAPIMTLVTPEYHRRSIRLDDYDYSQRGAYFVTISSHRHRPIFGIVSDGEMILNAVGKMIETWWWELTNKFRVLDTDAHIVMPNHFHGILMIVGADLRVCPAYDIDRHNVGAHAGAPLPRIMQWFKTMTTNHYIRGAKTGAWPRFSGKLWQRNYFEHIIRSEKSLNAVREYIEANPARWSNDPENPECDITVVA